MGQAANVIDINSIVHAAYRDNTETIAQLIPYLRERKMAADKYLNNVWEDEEAAKNALFKHIQFCNKAISIILGITPE